MRAAYCRLLLALSVATSSVAGPPVRVDELTVVDPETGRRSHLPAQQPPRRAPAELPRPHALGDGWVACSFSDDVFPFDQTTLGEGAPIPLRIGPASYPYEATLSPDGARLWVADASSDEAIVIDTASETVVDRIPVGEYPVSIAFTDDASLALVSSRDGGRIDVIDAGTLTPVSTVPVGTDGGNIALAPFDGRLFVVEWYGSDLHVISPDGLGVLQTLPVGVSLWQLVASPDGCALYVTDRGTDQVRVLDPATLLEIRAIPVGDDPWGIDVTNDGRTLVVACEDSHDVHLIDTTTWTVTVAALDDTAAPRDVDVADARGEAFVPGGRFGPLGMEVDPVYVIDLGTGVVTGSFESAGSNANVVAVQPQSTAGGLPEPDTDGDGLGNGCDNCPSIPNAAQEDRDADAVGDDCDNCPDAANPDQADADGDGVGDACQAAACPDPTAAVGAVRVTRQDADVVVAFDEAGLLDADHVNVHRGTVLALSETGGHDHAPAPGGCGVVASPWRDAGAAGPGVPDAYYLLALACADLPADREGPLGDGRDASGPVPRPSASDLGADPCP